MVSLTFWLAGLTVDGPTSLKLIWRGGVPFNAVLIIIDEVSIEATDAWMWWASGVFAGNDANRVAHDRRAPRNESASRSLYWPSVGGIGLEPMTSAMSTRRSNQLG